MATKKLLAMLLVLLMAVTPALATDAPESYFITVTGNNTSLLIPADTHPAETIVMANGSLGNNLLGPVVSPNGSLVVDATTANPNAAILILPLNMIADTKAYDTNTEFHAWTLLSRSGLRFNKDFMKAIFGSAVMAATQATLRSLVQDLGSLWDRSDDEKAQEAFAEAAAQHPSLSLEIGLDSANSAARMAQGETIDGKPIIGGVDVWIEVGGKSVKSSTPVQVHTRFALPAGGSAAGVTVLHDNGGKLSPVSCTVSGNDVFFDTTKRGSFYVVYDETIIPPASPVPATGDTNQLGLWFALMVGCGFAALSLLRAKKRV